MWALEQILFKSIDERVASSLWDAMINSKEDVLTITHEAIAKDIGSAREVVSRMLKYFESEGIVQLFRGGIRIIDKNKLKKVIK